MRVVELFGDKSEPEYLPRHAVYLDEVKEVDKSEVAGMRRGLMCAIEGWGAISGLTNDVLSKGGPVVLRFSSVDNAH